MHHVAIITKLLYSLQVKRRDESYECCAALFESTNRQPRVNRRSYPTAIALVEVRRGSQQFKRWLVGSRMPWSADAPAISRSAAGRGLNLVSVSSFGWGLERSDTCSSSSRTVVCVALSHISRVRA
jgi:hypothetical protein